MLGWEKVQTPLKLRKCEILENINTQVYLFMSIDLKCNISSGGWCSV